MRWPEMQALPDSRVYGTAIRRTDGRARSVNIIEFASIMCVGLGVIRACTCRSPLAADAGRRSLWQRTAEIPRLVDIYLALICTS